MTKGRKTTYEERIEIVAFCSENNNETTADKFKVSYQGVVLAKRGKYTLRQLLPKIYFVKIF